MKAVASKRRRFGYRRIHVMLQRQGISMEARLRRNIELRLNPTQLQNAPLDQIYEGCIQVWSPLVFHI
jgi:hypothetical protein